MKLSVKLYHFLKQKCDQDQPLLLALSGGPDSLALFYALIEYRKKTNCLFHVAHVDHRWREESEKEAKALSELCLNHEVPFHLKVLDPKELIGNLEDACRRERYIFFSEICKNYDLQAVLTGHHQGDLAETILKRVFEGAHWSKWESLKEENTLHEIRVLRPFLEVSKQDLQKTLEKYPFIPFDDSTNQDDTYLRPRLRNKIFPWLNQTFGKRVEPALLAVSKEMGEITDYFMEKLDPILREVIYESWGVRLDLKDSLPTQLLEIKCLIRLFCQKHSFPLNRTIIEHAALALMKGKKNQLFLMGKQKLRVERLQLYIEHN